MSYTLEYDGEERTLAEWSIEQPRITYLSAGRDMLTFRVKLASLVDDAPFAADEYLSLYRGATRIFFGCVLPLERGEAAEEWVTVRVAGAWYELEQRQYCQPWAQKMGPEEGGECNFGRVVLWARPEMWNPADPDLYRISSGAQIESIIDWAISRGAPFQLGDFSDGVSPMTEDVSDVTCADAITRILQWNRGGVFWADYSTDPVTVHFNARVDLDAESLGFGAFVRKGFQCGISDKPRVSGVIIAYKWTAEIASPTTPTLPDGWTWPPTVEFPEGAKYAVGFDLDKYPADVEQGDAGVVTASFDYNEYRTPTGGKSVARQVFEGLNALEWQGTGVLKGADVPQTIGLGDALNITGGKAAWATMGAPVLRLEDDLTSGERKVTWGALPGTNVGEMAMLFGQFRRRARLSNDRIDQQVSGSSKGQQWGSGSSSGPGTGEGEGESEWIDITGTEGFEQWRIPVLEKR